jgi:hypothetical protein
LTGSTGLAVDDVGAVHICYVHGFSAPGELRYARLLPGGEWQITPGLDIPGQEQPCAIDVDSTGQVRIVYRDTATDELLHMAFLPGETPTTSTVDISFLGSSYAMSLANDDTTHVIAAGDDQLEHRFRKDGLNWNQEVIQAGAISAAVAVNEAGVHVTYTTAAGDVARYGFRDPTGEWTLEDAVTDAGAVSYPDIAVSDDGAVHLSYASDNVLHYARRCSGD